MATNPKPQAPWGEYVARVGPMTVEQFAVFPSEDGWTYELYNGRLISIPGPGFHHAQLQMRLGLLIQPFLTDHQLGSIVGTSCYNLPLPNNTEVVLCPDLSYIHPTRQIHMQIRGSYPVLAPDLVIEIASPNDYHPQLFDKVQTYLASGVRLIWVVWPDPQTVEVWRPNLPAKPTAILSSNDTLDGLDMIPGFQCPVKDIFEP